MKKMTRAQLEEAIEKARQELAETEEAARLADLEGLLKDPCRYGDVDEDGLIIVEE